LIANVFILRFGKVKYAGGDFAFGGNLVKAKEE